MYDRYDGRIVDEKGDVCTGMTICQCYRYFILYFILFYEIVAVYVDDNGGTLRRVFSENYLKQKLKTQKIFVSKYLNITY